MQSYRTFLHPDKRGGSSSNWGDKAPPLIHHAQVICADPTLVPDPVSPTPATAFPRRSGSGRERGGPPPTLWQLSRFCPAPIPAWARASGRAGEGEPLFAAGAGLALLDAALRSDPPAAGALRARLALQSATASAKILRLNADQATLRDLRFAVGDPLGPAANLLSLWRDLAGRRPSLDPGRIRDVAARLDLAVDPNGLAASLKACVGEGDPVSAAAKAAGAVFSAVPDAPAPTPKSLRFGCSTRSSPSGCAGRGPCR